MQFDDDNSHGNSFKDNFVLNSDNNGSNDDTFRNGINILCLYEGKEAVGFDLSKASEWIYPTNYPVREYQKNIVSNALFKNTLVCLPTGLGKTFIAAVVMYNYHRWYPKHIVVFMAHSKPLVAQQVNACCSIMGINSSSIAELNGNMLHSNRKKQWETKKIFFLTPQVFNNDLARGNIKAERIRCLVIDEAHKALGNQAYCQVIRSIRPFNTDFRVLALSATPGDDMGMVREVIQNLMISHLELHSEEDPDIKPYLHKKKIETVVVKLDDQIIEIKDLFLGAVQKYVTPLVKHKILPQSYSSINPFSLVLKHKQFLQNPSVAPELRGLMLSNFSVAISLFYALEELIAYGMRSFVTKLKHLQSGEGSSNKVHHRIVNDSDIKSLIEHVDNILGPDNNISFDVDTSLTTITEIVAADPGLNIVYSHPKFVALERVIQDHFASSEESTRVIVFCKSRQCTGEICNFLMRFRPLVKPMIFIGQSQTSSGIVTKGFNQNAQLTVMKRFREGIYNTLVATCVAEEGLDVGEVDLIINFDSGKNSNTQVQRSGRTGRRRDGRVVNLVTEGRELQNYNISVSKGKKINKQLACDATKLPFYADNPRLLPKGFNPVCQELYLTTEKVVEEKPQGRKRKGKGMNNKKPRSTSVEGRISKKRKGHADGTGNINLYTVIPDKNFQTEDSQGKENILWNRGKSNCNELEKNLTFGRNLYELHRENYCEIEIIEREESEPATMLLYNDDVKEETDKPWESLSMDESEEKNLIVNLLRTNNIEMEHKSKFKELLNLEKYKKYLALCQKSDINLTSKMNSVKNYKLNQSDIQCLQNEELDVQTLAKFIVESRKRIFTTEDATSNILKVKGEEIKAPKGSLFNEEVNITNDIDPDEFLRPFEPCLSPSKPNVISSTPLRKRDEERVLKTVENTLASDSEFHNWDESDFFSVKGRYSPKHERDIHTQKASSAENDTEELSMITITQAIELINKTQTNNSNIQNKTDKNNDKSVQTSSPILFFSQKTKSVRNKLLPTSPILTQKTGSKISRKCLNFKEGSTATDSFQNLTNAAKKSKLEFDEAFDSSDLFAETEVALQNRLRLVEENLKDVENEDINLEEKVLVPSPTVSSNSSNETVDYDLRELKFDPNRTVSGSFAIGENYQNIYDKTRNHSDVENNYKEFNTDDYLENDIEHESQRDNENELSQSCFNLCLNNSSAKEQPDLYYSEKTEKSGPKMAVIRPVGFENRPLSNIIEKNVENDPKSKCSDNVKYREPSFVCSFSLFGEDDFSESCHIINPGEKKDNFTVENPAKRDVNNAPDEEFSDCDIVVTKEFHKNNISSHHTEKEIGKMSDDAELSEGTIEALKAVELFEENEKLAEKTASKMNMFDVDSDDSDDFFLPKKRPVKRLNISEHEQSAISEKAKPRKKSNKGKLTVAEFIDAEAEISDRSKVSSDEENTSALDKYESSFVDEREVFTQAQEVDMTAKYLQTTKSATAVRQGTLKIPKLQVNKDLNVFSQIGSEGESEYENDSFCVPEEEISELHEVTELELAEIVLQHRRKRKKNDICVGGNRIKKRKLKRVLRIESDSSENEVEVLHTELTENNDYTICDSDFQDLINSPFTEETEETSSSCIVDDISVKPVIFVASRQIASAPEITTCLRAKWNVNIQVRSSPEADYIVSWRVGVNRIQLSDFANGSPGAKSNLKEIISKLSRYFQKQVLIVEDDKNKGLPNTTGHNKTMWTNSSGRNLVKILDNGVKVIFSRSKDDTARILVLLCSDEKSKGQYIDLKTEINLECERKMKFYSSLPGVNIANAFRMINKFSSIRAFIKCCNSVNTIMREMGLKKEHAVNLYQIMFVSPYSLKKHSNSVI